MARVPFRGVLDVEALIREVEQTLATTVIDIPTVAAGANYYGFHVKLAGKPDVVARLSRRDINASSSCTDVGNNKQLAQDLFELATYKSLRQLSDVFGRSSLSYHEPIHQPPTRRGGRSVVPSSPTLPSITSSPQPRVEAEMAGANLGRRLFLFDKAPGHRFGYPCWRALSPRHKTCLLAQSARLAASLFRFRIPEDLALRWLLCRIIGPELTHLFPLAVTPTRDFCVALLRARIEAAFLRAVAHLGGDDVDAVLLVVRDTLLRLVPRLLPHDNEDNAWLYRFVLDHGDFGMHNMTIISDDRGLPRITSVFDWKGGSIVPALLSEPKMVVTVDLVIGEDGKPSVSRWGDGDSLVRMTEYMTWSKEYYEVLFAEAPEYETAMGLGRRARILWFALRDVERASLPAEPFFRLGGWAHDQLAARAQEDDERAWHQKGKMTGSNVIKKKAVGPFEIVWCGSGHLITCGSMHAERYFSLRPGAKPVKDSGSTSTNRVRPCGASCT